MPLDLMGIRAATYNTPKNYKESVKYYESSLQDKIDDVWEFASDNYEIGWEKERGTLAFLPVVCRVCHAIDPKTGKNLGDDFKDLKFHQIGEKRYMGERYQMDGSVWITTNTDNYHYPTQSAIIRRCNNVLSYITPQGVIVREPCIVGYSLKYANIYYNTTMPIPQGTIVITAQSNEFTQNIEINDRFIINSQVYKVKAVSDYLRSYTGLFDSVPLVELEVFTDAIAPDDDFALGIANMNRYDGIYPPKPKEPMDIVIEPEIKKLYQNERQVFSCYQYEDKKLLDTKFEFTAYNAPESTYKFNVVDSNHFEVWCLGLSKKMLIVNCSSDNGSTDVKIRLGGLY